MINLAKYTSNYRAQLILKSYRRWLKKDQKVLDLGCGNGIITKYLADNIDLNITCCDVKNYLVFDFPFVKIKSGKIPFGSKVFDIVMINDVLHHVKNAQQIEILSEALRVGKKVLIFEAKPTFFGKSADIILNKFHYGDLNQPLTFKNTNEWIKIFKLLKASYKTQELEKPFWYPFSHIAFEITKK